MSELGSGGLAASSCSGMLPFTTISNTVGNANGSESPDSNLAGCAKPRDPGNAAGQAPRLSRFAPTPWHEVCGNQVRYELPKPLTTKIRAALKKCLDERKL